MDDPEGEVVGSVRLQPASDTVDPGQVRPVVAIECRIGLQLSPPSTDLAFQPAVGTTQAAQPDVVGSDAGQGCDGVDHGEAQAVAPVGIGAVAAGEVTHRGEALHRRHDEETGADDRRIVADRVADGLRDAATLDRREYPGLAQHGLVTVRAGVPGRATQDHRGAVCPNQHEEVVLGSATEQSARDHRTISGGWTLGDPGLQGRPVQQAVTVLQQ